jgi:pimeloyl-ACP methyl ester carboxylesterase
VYAAAASLLTVALLALPALSTGAGATPGTSQATPAVLSVPVANTLTYRSSVDDWPLSYQEWLPSGFVSTQAYPLAVYLHDALGTNASWISGGETQFRLASQSWGPAFIQSARTHGFILIVPNTRTLSGFYVNSPYTGPQERDILDAISHEEIVRSVSSVYLVGNGMGSVGALDLAVHHEAEFAGIGVIGDCGDAYEALQWAQAQSMNSTVREDLQPSGGQWPNQTAAASTMYYDLSASRFYPQNLTNLSVYYVAGGNDRVCPNNPLITSYQQANQTVLRPSCSVASRIGEPSNCTVPMTTESGNLPDNYVWRYDYVASGNHSPAILDPNDLFGFWNFQLPGGLVCGLPDATPAACARPGNTAGPFSTQYYRSSVDGTLLSYYEWLPAGYVPSSRHALLLYLHGKGAQGDQLYQDLDGVTTINDALAAGYIVVALNTRNAGGFYVNSPYTGPEEQDVLDAIAHEKALRLVSALWVFGVSMGTMGAYSLAEHHPGLVRGIGVIASCADLYEVQAYKIAENRTSDFSYFLNTTGGYLANQSAYAAAETYYLSAFRFYPQNLTGVRLYIVQGGNDTDCPNNPQIWGFQQANNTILNSTCLVATNLSEPAGCTTPFSSLEARNPSKYHYRFVYVATGIHTLDLLDPADMLAYFASDAADGLYWASPGGTPFPPG